MLSLHFNCVLKFICATILLLCTVKQMQCCFRSNLFVRCKTLNLIYIGPVVKDALF